MLVATKPLDEVGRISGWFEYVGICRQISPRPHCIVFDIMYLLNRQCLVEIT